MLAVDLNYLVTNIINAVSLGSLYALFALGIALVFGIMGLINFAHGELIMVSGYAIVLSASALLLWPVLVAITLATALVFALGMERVAFRPIRGADPVTLLVTSFAVSFFLQNLALLIFGGLPRVTNLFPSLNTYVDIGGLAVRVLDMVTFGVTIAVLSALGAFLTKTRLGLQMRAAAEDFRMARVLGVRANLVVATAFATSGFLAGVASLLLMAQTASVSPTTGSFPVLVAFIATVIGGMGSLRGAVVGGFTISVLTVALQAYLPLELRPYRDAFTFTGVILILLLRPQGLMAGRSVSVRV